MLGGRLADWSIPRTLVVGFVSLACVFTLFWATSNHRVAAAVGAFLGGTVIAVGFGYRAPMLVAGLLALLGLGVLLVAERLDRNGRLPVEVPASIRQPEAVLG